MITCPNCRSEVEDNFEVCWNCQYSFIDNKILASADFKLLCPGCKTLVEQTMHYCPVCRFDLSKYQAVNKAVNDKVIECSRCQIPLFFKGKYDFQEGYPMSRLFINCESFDLYVCPKCGKVEFFIPE